MRIKEPRPWNKVFDFGQHIGRRITTRSRHIRRNRAENSPDISYRLLADGTGICNHYQYQQTSKSHYTSCPPSPTQFCLFGREQEAKKPLQDKLSRWIEGYFLLSRGNTPLFPSMDPVGTSRLAFGNGRDPQLVLSMANDSTHSFRQIYGYHILHHFRLCPIISRPEVSSRGKADTTSGFFG